MTYLYLYRKIIFFQILSIWEHDTSLIFRIKERITILHLPDLLPDGTNLLQLRKLQMILPELRYLLQLSLKGIYLSLKFIKLRLLILEYVNINTLIQTPFHFLQLHLNCRFHLSNILKVKQLTLIHFVPDSVFWCKVKAYL